MVRRQAGRPRGWSSSLGRVKNFYFSISFRPALGPTRPPIHWVPVAPSSRLKRPRRETDHSPPTGTEVKKNSSYISTRPYVFIS
jgi:hypothetical protein